MFKSIFSILLISIIGANFIALADVAPLQKTTMKESLDYADEEVTRLYIKKTCSEGMTDRETTDAGKIAEFLDFAESVTLTPVEKPEYMSERGYSIIIRTKESQSAKYLFVNENGGVDYYSHFFNGAPMSTYLVEDKDNVLLKLEEIYQSCGEEKSTFEPKDFGYSVYKCGVTSVLENTFEYNFPEGDDNRTYTMNRDDTTSNFEVGEELLYYELMNNNKLIILYSQKTGASIDDKVEFFTKLEILRGYSDGTIKLDRGITRAEFLVLLLRIFEHRTFSIKSTYVNQFEDVENHWAKDYINTAYNLGLVNGVSETEFLPDSNISYEEMVTMTVRTVGLGEYAAKNGGFPAGYMYAASENGIIDSKPHNQLVTREDAVNILFNIMVHKPIEKWVPEPPLKPVIYLYPEKEKNVRVRLGNPENLTTYPEYPADGWSVTAEPDGTLYANGREYYCLYWEGGACGSMDVSCGFIVRGEDSAAFLEEKLKILGLTDREANEFIIYWLPKLEENKSNFINFRNIELLDIELPLIITPKPDSIIRILMDYKAVDAFYPVTEQTLTTPKREGFTVVEWGGRENH